MMLFISHLPIDVWRDPWVLPVGVGGIEPEGGISDRMTGLDAVNPQVCEWTGILTAAAMLRDGRLVTDSPWIGTCHYRRLLWLTPHPHGTFRDQIQRQTRNPMLGCRALIDPAHVSDLLREFDAIVPRTLVCNQPLSAVYAASHLAEDWAIFVEEVSAQFGVDAARFFDFTHAFTPCSMFVMTTARFLAYCEDAKAMVDRLLARIPRRADREQNRAIGFLMERFVTFTIHHMRLRVFQTPLVLLDSNARG